MVQMLKDGKTYEIDDHRVEKLLKRGFELVEDTPDPEDVKPDQEDLEQDGEI